eukprot:9554713-Karenia_brevis.AAC.1
MIVVEFFSGLLPVSVAASRLKLPVLATFYSEIVEVACYVASHNFPSAEPIGDICSVTHDWIVS